MAGVGTVSNVPSFLKASSPKGLHRLMLLNNLKHGNRFKYQDIQFVNGAWYVWYYLDINFRELIPPSLKR